MCASWWARRVLAADCRLVRLAGTDWIRSSVVDHNLDTVAALYWQAAGRQEVK